MVTSEQRLEDVYLVYCHPKITACHIFFIKWDFFIAIEDNIIRMLDPYYVLF